VPVSNRLNHPLPESRKRGWVPSSSEPSYASTNEDFTTGFFDTPKYSDVNEMGSVSSMPAFGLDGRGRSRTVSGVGDRRKRDDANEGEGENAMDPGECRFPFIKVLRLRHCFIPLSHLPGV
jgi:hypothetical protein